MRSFARFLGGVLLGASIGAAVTILLVPAPGSELQSEIRSRVENIQIEVQKAARERRQELEDQLAHLRAG